MQEFAIIRLGVGLKLEGQRCILIQLRSAEKVDILGSVTDKPMELQTNRLTDG